MSFPQMKFVIMADKSLKDLKVLVLVYADPSGNPRPKRMIELLKEQGAQVHVASFSFKSAFSVDFFYPIERPSYAYGQRIARKLLSLAELIVPRPLDAYVRARRWGFSSIDEQVKNTSFDLIIVEDIHFLPLAFSIQKKARIIFDAREYYPAQKNTFFWRVVEKSLHVRTCKRYLKRCASLITVSQGLALQYSTEFSVPCDVIRSVPGYQEIAVPSMHNDPIRLVHHGVANRVRKLENLIEIATRLGSQYQLDLYLSTSGKYRNFLEKLAETCPNVTIHKPVAFQDIIPTMAAYDIGLCFFPPVTFNLLHCLPNKFFEYIQARLMIFTGPSPDMADIVSTYQCGVISPSFDVNDAVALIKSITLDDILRAKKASDVAARALCFEEEKKKLLSILTKVAV